jgi:hypothetical protein
MKIRINDYARSREVGGGIFRHAAILAAVDELIGELRRP